MKTFSDIGLIQAYINEIKAQHKKISFVPTMGALHEGHLSLIKHAKNHSDFVIVSIFVNPTQFGPNEDFSSYPRTIDQDKALLESLNIDVLFYPSKQSMYPSSINNTSITISSWEKLYCGESRPVFFQGICSIVLRLFNIIRPDCALFGLKDFQQYTIIKKMTTDLFLPITILGLPIIRNQDGLALSSRNSYLSNSQLKEAATIYKSLTAAKQHFNENKNITSEHLISYIKANLAPSIKVDYCVIIDSNSLKEVSDLAPGLRILFAGYLETTRLIDNIEL